MFGKSLTLFELFGFKIKVDLSWIFIAVLVTWSLARGYFPTLYADLATATYWSMGAVGAFGLFASLIFHELAHSLVARHYGLAISGITLFIFGGVAELEEEPKSPKAEFLMALAGPAASLLLTLVFYVLYYAAKTGGQPASVFGVAGYLSMINGVLAVFNLVPAFPLDGGRALRAALWWRRDDMRAATKTAAATGSAFGAILIALSFVYLVLGNFVAAVWMFLIGLFVRNAAKASYYQMLTQKMLEGVPVSRFMTPDPISVTPDISVRELLDGYVYRFHHKMFPVTERGALVGCVTLREIRDVPHEERQARRVGQIMAACTPDNCIEAETAATNALAVLSRSGDGRLVVVQDGRLVGIVALKDIMDFVQTKMELDDFAER